MNQSRNEVYIEGILLEHTIVPGTTSENKNYVRGELKIQVEQMVGGENITSVIPVRMFAMEFTTDKQTGKPEKSKIYKSILAIKDTFISAATAGDPALADAVRINKGSLMENVFTPKGSDKEVSLAGINSNFLTKIPKETLKPLAHFSVDIAINSIKEEMKMGEPTGALIIRGGVVQYADRLDLIDFKVVNPSAINHIRTNYKPGDTVNLKGAIVFSSETSFIEEEAGFGEATLIPKTTTVRDLIVTTGSIEPFDEERALKKADLNAALDARLARIKEGKEKATVKTPQKEVNRSNGF